MDKSQISKKYIEYVLEHGHKPTSIFAFAKSLSISESEFYNFYTSFEAIESDFWSMSCSDTLSMLESDAVYATYTSKDKLLAFYYLWISKLRENRSYVVSLKSELIKAIPMNANGLETFKKLFLKYVDQLVNEGIDGGEIQERKYISDKYIHGFWIQTMFILNYWIKDRSDNFEMTDAAIEKSVNVSFKLIGSDTLETMLDFGKFLIQKNK